MLNRRHVRVKVMQALYSYWSVGDSLRVAEVEHNLGKNIEKLYELYLFLLLFLKELMNTAELYDDDPGTKYFPESMAKKVNTLFYQNKIAGQLQSNEKFLNEVDKYKLMLDSESKSMLRKIFIELKNIETYQDYIKSDDAREEQEFELFSYIIKYYPENYSLLEQFLEEKFINWYDDKIIAIQMVLKTLKHIISNPHTEDFIIPLSRDEESILKFSSELFNTTIEHQKDFDELIVTKIEKWEPSRIPLIDMILLRMGLAEFLYFKTIPTKVTINEYIEVSKNYSTRNSNKFINGMLDNLLTELRKENKVVKEGPGLVETYLKDKDTTAISLPPEPPEQSKDEIPERKRIRTIKPNTKKVLLRKLPISNNEDESEIKDV